MADESDKGFLVNEKTMEVLVAKFIPTSQYFERSFEVLQTQIGDVREGQRDLKREMDRRFEQVDKRFEQVDKRFEQINVKLDTIIERVDVRIDAGLRENRSMSFKLFSFAMVFSAISMAGLLGKLIGLF
jgi:hypothetical protein